MSENGSWVTVRVHPGSHREAVIAALFEQMMGKKDDAAAADAGP